MLSDMKHITLSAVLGTVLLASCGGEKDSPGLEFMPDMYPSPSVEAYVDYGQDPYYFDDELVKSQRNTQSARLAPAGTVIATDAIPTTYEAWHRFSSVMFMLYMAMAYLACAGLGWDVLRTGMVARWAGWFAIAFGLSAGAVVGRNIPMMVHIPLLIIAVLLLKR